MPALAVCADGSGGGGINTALSEIARWLGPGWRRCSASPESELEAGRDQTDAGIAVRGGEWTGHGRGLLLHWRCATRDRCLSVGD